MLKPTGSSTWHAKEGTYHQMTQRPPYPFERMGNTHLGACKLEDGDQTAGTVVEPKGGPVRAEGLRMLIREEDWGVSKQFDSASRFNDVDSALRQLP